MTMGERIRERRIELNLTQDELAQKAGYKSRSSINKIEKTRELPLKKVTAIAKALDCPPSYIMGWMNDPDDPDCQTPMLDAAIRDNRIDSPIVQTYLDMMLNISHQERDMIIAFREADIMTQRNIYRILGLDEKNLSSESLKAAGGEA